MQWFASLQPEWQALLAGIFTWAITTGGAACVFLTRRPSPWLIDGMLGFAAGVMIAASFWSLLAPGIEIAEEISGLPAWLVATLGFCSGALMMMLADRLLPHLHSLENKPEGLRAAWRRSTLLMTAMTLHNIPEGLAVGVAFGAAAQGGEAAVAASLSGAVVLAIGIGLQNFPEGIAVAIPLRHAGTSRRKAFAVGQASALVEPIAALIGAWVVSQAQVILPYALTFAAGAMIFVVVEELIPQAQQHGREDLATGATLLGFTVMMVLDVALG